jgi:hypothetical protein
MASKGVQAIDTPSIGSESKIYIAVKSLVESSKVSWKSEQESVSKFDSTGMKGALLTVLADLREESPELRCNTCVVWVNEQIEKKPKWTEKIKQNKRRSAGWSWDFSSKVGLFCKFHDTVHIPATFFQQFFESMDDNTALSSPYSVYGRHRIARKCVGIHPHCSICGMCHTNRRTHDQGHPRT